MPLALLLAVLQDQDTKTVSLWDGMAVTYTFDKATFQGPSGKWTREGQFDSKSFHQVDAPYVRYIEADNALRHVGVSTALRPNLTEFRHNREN